MAPFRNQPFCINPLASPYRSSKALARAFLIGWTIWFCIHLMVLLNFGFSLRQASLDSLISNIFLAGSGWLIGNNMRYYLPGKERYGFVLVISLGFGLIWFIFIRWILGFIFQGDSTYLKSLNSSLLIRFGIGYLILVCVSTLCLLWFTQKEQMELELRNREIEKGFKEAELFKLRQQLQPHFLFNSLNSISALIGTRPDQARTMIQQLSDFLRRTLKKEEQKWVELEEELNYLGLYLEIEKVRFGHRLSTEIRSDHSCNSLKIPPLLLQPIVENAIKFGLYDTTENICIRILAKEENRTLVIQISNPFDIETSASQKGTGFGLSSINRRLYLLFGRRDLLSTSSEGNIYYTNLIIPQGEDSNLTSPESSPIPV